MSDHIVIDKRHMPHHAVVRCENCQHHVVRRTVDAAVKTWNHREPEAKRIAELEAELVDYLDEAMRLSAHCVTTTGDPWRGWWDSMALSAVCSLGDRLVDLGAWERHPRGAGRRWFYRPIEKERADGDEH